MPIETTHTHTDNSYVMVLRAMSRSPLYFAKVLFKEVFYTPFAKWHRTAVKKFVNAKKKITVVCVTRGFGKTKLFLFLMPIWFALFGKVSYIILISWTQDKSMQTLRDIKRGVTSPLFVKIFGDMKGSSWGAERLHLYNPSLGVDCLIEAKGAGQQLLGASEWASRPDLIMMDDLEDPQQAAKQERVDELAEWLSTVVIPALAAKNKHGQPGRILWTGTPLSSDCLMTRAMSWGHDTELVKFPCLDGNDQSIWEEQFSTKDLHAMRDSYVARGAYSAWMSQYMLDPRAMRVIAFNRKKLIMMKPEDADLTVYEKKIITVDMAYTQKTYSDNVGVVVCGHQKGQKFVVLEAIRGKYDQDALFDLLWELHVKYNTTRNDLEGIYVESLSYQLVEAFFREKGVSTGKILNVYPLKRFGRRYNENKDTRIGMLIPYQTSGLMRVVEERCLPLLDEMYGWGGTKFRGGKDDLLDALSFQLEFLEDSPLKIEYETVSELIDEQPDRFDASKHIKHVYQKIVEGQNDYYDDDDMFLSY